MVKFEEDGLVPSHLLDRASVDSGLAALAETLSAHLTGSGCILVSQGMADLFNTLDVDGSGKINRSLVPNVGIRRWRPTSKQRQMKTIEDGIVMCVDVRCG